MPIRTYDPAGITCVFAGVPITGFADGTFVSAERKTDTFALTVGAGGEAARSRSRDQSGKVTFTLLSTSPTNDLLSAIAATDEASGEGVGPLMIKDLNGTTLLHADSGWIVKPPTVEYGKEVSNREWVIECSLLEMNVGSNALSI